jgi:hypothetical protein
MPSGSSIHISISPQGSVAGWVHQSAARASSTFAGAARPASRSVKVDSSWILPRW